MMPLLLTLGLSLLATVACLAIVLVGRWLDARTWAASLVAYRLRLPAGLDVAQVAAWLGAVAAGTHAPRFALLPPPPIVLELVATRDGIGHVLCVPRSMHEALLGSLRAHVPGVRTDEQPDYLSGRTRPGFAVEAYLHSDRRPLADDRAAQASAGILAALQPLAQDERVRVQWILTGAGTPRPVPSASVKPTHPTDSGWVPGELRSDPDEVRAQRLKQQAPLLYGCLRVAIEADSRARTYSLFGRVWGAHRLLNAPGAQIVRRLIPSCIVTGRFARFSLPVTRWPLLLNTSEAAGLVGLPAGGVTVPGVALGTARQLPPPSYLPRTGAVIGMSNYPGMTERPLALRDTDRRRHALILGPTGSGKSWLLTRLILGDIAAGRGVFAIDMKGDLIGDVISRVSDTDAERITVIDPSQRDYPVGFNVLAAADNEEQRELVVDNVLTVFKELWAAYWGPRSDQIMRAALQTLVTARALDGSRFTLVELVPLLADPAFRHHVVQSARLPDSLRTFWERYEAMRDGERNQAIAPVLNKIEAFTSRSAIRLLLGQSEGIDLRDIFRKRAVILVNLPKGSLGSETANLLSALLVTKLWHATQAQVAIPAERRRTAFAYLDEAQDIVRLPVPMADVLAQARGLGLGVTLAHQFVAQLPEAVKAAVLGTVQTQIVFALKRIDAQTLAPDFGPLGVDDLTGLDAFEVAMRPCVGGKTLTPVTGTTLPLEEAVRDGAALARARRQIQGVPRAVIEAALHDRVTTPHSSGQAVGWEAVEEEP
jgi:hypothetical protein